MPSPKRKFGDAGEMIAEKYLQEKGYLIIDRNFRKPYGEIDLIAKKDNMLVFIEVKTRDGRYIHDFLPEQSVNRPKTRKLKRVCQVYLLEKHYGPNQEWQIDVIGISIDFEFKKARIGHLENAVWERQY
ncbi:MAG: YraN family protein [Candidatus Sungbacteria bacterium]|nr:YraN family protein [Candidatus Sungbacteria bacterium]